MTSPHRWRKVESALGAAPAHSLPEALTAAVLTELPQASSLRLLLADYQRRILLPVDDGVPAKPVQVNGTPAGRAFTSLRPVPAPAIVGTAGERRLYTPVTARGERLGVLEIRLTAEPGGVFGEPLITELARLGEIVGCALKLAWTFTDRYERARRHRRLTLAAELQWQLLPGHGYTGAEYSLAGQLEPAYAVRGDNFDWAAERDHLTLSVTNGSGNGVQAALLTSLTVGALRNARRSGADLAEQVSLAGDMVYARYRGNEFTENLVLRIELADGTVSVVDAGSPRILRMRGIRVEHIELDHQMPLGMFPDTRYQVERFRLEAGDRLIVVSDGVSDARSPDGDAFGAVLLERALQRVRPLDASQVPFSIIKALLDHRQAADLDDDAVAVCLDWN